MEDVEEEIDKVVNEDSTNPCVLASDEEAAEKLDLIPKEVAAKLAAEIKKNIMTDSQDLSFSKLTSIL